MPGPAMPTTALPASRKRDSRQGFRLCGSAQNTGPIPPRAHGFPARLGQGQGNCWHAASMRSPSLPGNSTSDRAPTREEACANLLLAGLPADAWERWQPVLEVVDLNRGDVLYDGGDPISHVVFPTTAIVSLQYLLQDGRATEIAIIGRPGMVGVSRLRGGENTPSRAVVQYSGQAMRLPADFLEQEFTTQPAVMHMLLRYMQALITQMAQNAVCHRHHSIEQHLCRWLLLNLDRMHSNELPVTHENIAQLLGVRREGVTEAAGQLQRAGLIGRRRGHITVLDRPGLEARCCECYAVVRREYDRLLPPSSAA